MLDGISKLAPAHLLVADRNGLAVRRYWAPAAVATRPSRLDTPATLRDVLLRAVERELRSDVPVGVFTSGGLDSSLLAAAAARVMAGGGGPTPPPPIAPSGVRQGPPPGTGADPQPPRPPTRPRRA